VARRTSFGKLVIFFGVKEASQAKVLLRQVHRNFELSRSYKLQTKTLTFAPSRRYFAASRKKCQILLPFNEKYRNQDCTTMLIR
jgi:hypothetical protein